MIYEFELIKQYQRACEYASKKEKLAYSLEWTFVKNLICKAYRIEKNKSVYPDNENDYINVRLINENIEDDTVREIMHSIRKNRNDYEHGNLETLEDLEIPNINSVKRELDDIINYINNNCNNNFQFIGRYVNLQINKDEIDDSSLKLIPKIQEKGYNYPYKYTIYNNAYVRENSYFFVNSFIDKCINPIFAVIHNILIRSDNIKINNLILEENLSIYEIQEVYKFQIALLTLLSTNDGNQFTIKVSKSEKKIATVALKNIMFYYKIISKMANIDEKIVFNLIISKNISFNTIEVNEKEIYFDDLDLSENDRYVNNSHVFISNVELKYEINKDNEKFYNVLLNEIFEIQQFRVGQIETLNEFFKDNRPLMSILPTGYGKSLIYQFIAIIYPKIMWIVSPDEFLVSDQISNLRDKNIYRANYITDIGTINPRIDLNGKKIPVFRSNINYITAEGILSDRIMKILRNLADEKYISAISIDECHKTSIWGHQFSSRYSTLIKQLIEYLSECKFLLLSATVATRVKNEISGQISKLKVIQPCPLKRENIGYDVESFDDIKSIVDYIEERYKKSSNASGEISDLSIVVNNDEKVLSEIMSQLKKRDGLIDKCFMFDGNITTYEEFKISHRAILFVTDEYLTGINVNNLNNLFIVGMPISKEWFYQQSGRVGRYLKDGFVAVLLLNEEANDIINNIVNNQLKIYDEAKIRKYINHTNLTELTNPVFEYDENIIKIACQILTDIKKCVFVPTGEKNGRVIGRIPNGMFDLYDMPIYILLYMGIVKNVRYLQEEELDVTYRIYVEPNIDIWFRSSKEKVRKNIMYESYNDIIQKSHLYELEIAENVEKVVEVVLHWLDSNSSKLKHEMFKNIYKLIMQNIEDTDTEYIENDLTNYFAVGSSNLDYEVEETNLYDETENELIHSLSKLDFNDTIQDNEYENIEFSKENGDNSDVEEVNGIYDETEEDSNDIYDDIEEDSDDMYDETEKDSDDMYDDIEEDSNDIYDDIEEDDDGIYDDIDNEIEDNIQEGKISLSDGQNSEYKEIDVNNIKKELNKVKDIDLIEKIQEVKDKKEIIEEAKKIEKAIKNSNNIKDDDELIKFLKIEPDKLNIIISIVKEDIIKNHNELKAHIERSIEEKYSKICLVALSIYELLDTKERVFLRLKELNQEDKVLFYDLLNRIKEEIDLTRMYWIDKFLIKNKFAFSFVPLRYYTFYELTRSEKDIINDIELTEDKIPKVEAILTCIYDLGKYITALKGLAVIEINYKNLSSLNNFEKLVKLKDYKKLLETEKYILTKREKILIDEFLKKRNEDRYYYSGLFGLIRMLFEK